MLYIFPACYSDRHCFRVRRNRYSPKKTKHKKAVRSYERTADFQFVCIHRGARCHFRTELTTPASSTVFLRLQSELNLTVMCRSVSPMVDGQKVLSKKKYNTLLAAPRVLQNANGCAEFTFQMEITPSASPADRTGSAFPRRSAWRRSGRGWPRARRGSRRRGQLPPP